MDKECKYPNVLRLTGISLEDYRSSEDLLDERLIESAEARPPPLEKDKPEQGHPYSKIPKVFTEFKNWPKTTNLKCWMSGLNFDTAPVFVGTHITPTEAGVEIGVLGNFYTFSHAADYIDTPSPPEERSRLREILCTVYKLFTGKTIYHIEAAPKKTEMIEYGGTLSREDYLKKVMALDAKHGLVDHTPGSIRPERERVAAAKNSGEIANKCVASPKSRDAAAAGFDERVASPEPTDNMWGFS